MSIPEHELSAGNADDQNAAVREPDVQDSGVLASSAGEFYPSVGVGPHPKPWPEGDQWDIELLAQGDRRNVVDRYRYWTVEAIKADLDKTRSTLHVAIENWQHDLNIGSIVRTANAFNVAAVHIIGRRAWNRRGAMVTDKYMNVMHHSDARDLKAWAQDTGTTVVGVEQTPSSVPIQTFPFPQSCCLVLGNEGLGLTAEALSVCDAFVEIPQSGSTRSINASAAGAIAMWAWSSATQAMDVRPVTCTKPSDSN